MNEFLFCFCLNPYFHHDDDDDCMTPSSSSIWEIFIFMIKIIDRNRKEKKLIQKEDDDEGIKQNKTKKESNRKISTFLFFLFIIFFRELFSFSWNLLRVFFIKFIILISFQYDLFRSISDIFICLKKNSLNSIWIFFFQVNLFRLSLLLSLLLLLIQRSMLRMMNEFLELKNFVFCFVLVYSDLVNSVNSIIHLFDFWNFGFILENMEIFFIDFSDSIYQLLCEFRLINCYFFICF